MKLTVILALVLITTGLAPSAIATPLHVSVDKPLTRVRDILADLSQQSGIPILADDTVIDTLGVASINKPTLEEMLNTLDALGQGMTWQRVYLPQDTPLPAAAALAAQVRMLRGMTATGLVVVDPASPGTLTFSKSPQPAPATPPAGMKAVYLVTNEVVRAQREANLAARAKQEAAPATLDPATTAWWQSLMQAFRQESGGSSSQPQQPGASPSPPFVIIVPGADGGATLQWPQGSDQGGGDPRQ